MNNKTLVKLSNMVGMVSIILLIYWVFIFISIEVFGFKVFRKNITETFYMSILAVLALMGAALIINIMFNLTRIAEKHNQDDIKETKLASKKLGWMFILSLPVIFGLLFFGDYLTSRKKEKLLIASARSIVEGNAAKMNAIVNYSFNKKWINETEDALELVCKTDKNISNVIVVTRDSIDQTVVFLGFNSYHYNTYKDSAEVRKKDFIRATTKEERDYMNQVFDENILEIKFSAHEGHYELFYPYQQGNKKVVLYFSDYQRYGKSGR
jgi:hypothetical protein